MTGVDATAGGMAAPGKRRVPRNTWHFTPDLPITQAPYCEWPLKPGKCLVYLLKSWSPLAERFFILLAAIAIWHWFVPSLERTATFRFDWMFEIWLRNFILVLTIAGGLHLWFFTFAGQGDEMRYDKRPLARDSRVFHFGNQVWDNMFWTLGSSVLVGTLFECLMLWAYANGYAVLITFTENPGLFIGVLLLIPVWSGFHFYWFHRALHIGPLYRHVHSWHHKNVNTGPWSGHAMHPVEHIGLYSDALIYFLVASHPIHMIFNLLLHTIAGPTSHCGYDKLKLSSKVQVQLGDFMHQLHHKYIHCNYGTYETPWDKIFGSFHDGTPEGDRHINERRRRILARKSERRAGNTA